MKTPIIAIFLLIAVSIAHETNKQDFVDRARRSFYQDFEFVKNQANESPQVLVSRTAEGFRQYFKIEASQDTFNACFENQEQLFQAFIEKITEFRTHLNSLNILGFFKTLGEMLPKEMWTCIKKSNILTALKAKHDIPQEYKKYMGRIVLYQTLHNFSEMLDNLSDIHGYQHSGEYENLGKVVAACVDKLSEFEINNEHMIHFIERINGDPMQIIQEAVSGFAQRLGTHPPSAIFPCFANSNPQGWVDFAGTALHKAANLNIFNIGNFLSYVKDYLSTIPQETKDCFNSTDDVIAYEQILGIQGLSSDDIEHRVQKNAITHLGTVLNAVKTLNNNFERQQFTTLGTNAADAARIIFK